MPFPEAIELFDLRPGDLLPGVSVIPRFGDVTRDLWYAGYKHVVVEVEPEEERKGWKAGFYRSKVTPKEAFRRLVQQPFADELGRNNVVRLKYEPTTDSQGRSTFKISVVISPNATRRLASDAALNSIVALQKRFREMQIEGTPIIEFATEAELAQDADT